MPTVADKITRQNNAPTPTADRKDIVGAPQMVATLANLTDSTIPDYVRENGMQATTLDTGTRYTLGPDLTTWTPESGGGTITPLSSVRYADVNTTVPVPSQNGSEATPFATLTGALTSCPADGVVYVADGDYSTEGLITLSKSVTITAMDQEPPMCLNQAGNTHLGVTIDSLAVPVGVELDAKQLVFGTGVDVATGGVAFFDSCSIQTITGDGTLGFRNSVVNSTTTCATFQAADDCAFGNITFSSSDVQTLNNCVVSSQVTFSGTPGFLSLDVLSYDTWVKATCTIVNGRLDVRGGIAGGDLRGGSYLNTEVVGVRTAQVLVWSESNDLTKPYPALLAAGDTLVAPPASSGLSKILTIDDTNFIMIRKSDIVVVNVVSPPSGFTQQVITPSIPDFAQLDLNSISNLIGVYDGVKYAWFAFLYQGITWYIWKVDPVTALWTRSELTLTIPSVLGAVFSIEYANGQALVTISDQLDALYKIVKIDRNSLAILDVVPFPNSAFVPSSIASASATASTATVQSQNYAWFGGDASAVTELSRFNPSTLVHTTPDATYVTSPLATDQTSLETLLNETLAKYAAHLLQNDSSTNQNNPQLHTESDTVNFTTTGPATDPGGGPYTNSMAVANDLKNRLDAHLLNRGSHFYYDYANLIALPDLTDDTNLAAIITRANLIAYGPSAGAFNAHVGQARLLVHEVAYDNMLERAVAATSQVTGENLINDLASKYEVHRVQPGVHATDDTVNVITAPAANDPKPYPTSAALANDLKVKILAHFHEPGIHSIDDTFSLSPLIATPDAAADDLASIIALANAIGYATTNGSYNAHRTASGVHLVDDTTNIVTTAIATDLTSVKTLLNDCKTQYEAHRVDTTYHLVADGVNTITAANATDPAPGPASYPTLMALTNDLVVQLAAHFTQAGVHTNNDTLNTFTIAPLADDTDLGAILTVINELGISDGAGVTTGYFNQHLSHNSEFVESFPDSPGFSIATSLYASGGIFYAIALTTDFDQDSPHFNQIFGEDQLTTVYPPATPPAGYSGSVWNYRDYVPDTPTPETPSFGLTTPECMTVTTGGVVWFVTGFDDFESPFRLNRVTNPAHTIDLSMLVDAGLNPTCLATKGPTSPVLIGYSSGDYVGYVDPNGTPVLVRLPMSGTLRYAEPSGAKFAGHYSLSDPADLIAPSWTPVVMNRTPAMVVQGDRFDGFGGVWVGASKTTDRWVCHLNLDVTPGVDNVIGARIAYQIDDTSEVAAPGATTQRTLVTAVTNEVNIRVVITGVEASRLRFIPEVMGADTVSINMTVTRLCMTVEKA